MIEIRFHGRGGQGAVTAADILAVAVGHNKKYSQSFPFFGVERRGAPLLAFCRIDDKPIRIHKNIELPDYVVVLDSTLLDNVDVCKGIKKGGTVVVNSHMPDAEIMKKLSVKDVKLHVLDASSVARKHLGSPIVNTTMLGALARITGWISMKNLEMAVKERFEERPELIDKNIAAMENCYKLCKGG